MVNGVPQQGDIIKLNLNPRMGHEQQGFRPVIVLSNNIVPQYTNVVIAAPISTTQRRLPLYRDLPGGLMTAGTVLLDQLVTLDYKARSFQFIETVPQVFFLNCHYTNWGEMAVAAPYRAHSSVSPCPREKFRGENFLYALAPP